jgi:hypothetical protein
MASMLEGTPGSTSSTVSTQTPPWMQDAIFNTISWAQNLANKPYVAYEGPRVAGFTPTQQAGMQAAIGAAGSYQPYLGSSMGTLGQAAGTSAAGAAAGALGRAEGMSGAGAAQPFLSRAAGISGLSTAQPLMMQGVDPIRMAGQGSAAAAASPFLQQALGESPLAAAQPYLQQAGQTFPGAVSQYMNPYTESVVNRIGDLGVRQLQEKLLPAVGEEFIRAGQFGGSRMGEFGARALRDVQESVLAEQSKALQAGYGQAADIFGADVGRQAQLAATAGQLGGAQQRALLEAGQTTGQLSTNDLQRLLQSGVSIADIGQRFGELAGQDAARLSQIGATTGQLTGQDASRLADIAATRGQLSAQDAANLRAIAQQQGALGEAAQTLGLRGAGAITGVGQAEQNLAQRALDLAYEQFGEESRYPYEQLKFQAGIIGGFPASSTGTTSTTSSTTRAPEPSDLAKILAALGGATGLYKTWKGE